jgi:hypothetical protein
MLQGIEQPTKSEAAFYRRRICVASKPGSVQTNLIHRILQAFTGKEFSV